MQSYTICINLLILFEYDSGLVACYFWYLSSAGLHFSPIPFAQNISEPVATCPEQHETIGTKDCYGMKSAIVFLENLRGTF